MPWTPKPLREQVDPKAAHRGLEGTDRRRTLRPPEAVGPAAEVVVLDVVEWLVVLAALLLEAAEWLLVEAAEWLVVEWLVVEAAEWLVVELPGRME